MEKILAIDPHKRCFAAAYFVDGILKKTQFTRSKEENLYYRAKELERGIPKDVTEIVIEEMIVYEQKGPVYRASPDPNGLIAIAIISGVFARGFDCPITLVPARTWKGQLSKRMSHPRIISRLSVEEKSLLPESKTEKGHIKDAIGIGLWRLGRMGR